MYQTEAQVVAACHGRRDPVNLINTDITPNPYDPQTGDVYEFGDPFVQRLVVEDAPTREDPRVRYRIDGGTASNLTTVPQFHRHLAGLTGLRGLGRVRVVDAWALMVTRDALWSTLGAVSLGSLRVPTAATHLLDSLGSVYGDRTAIPLAELIDAAFAFGICASRHPELPEIKCPASHVAPGPQRPRSMTSRPPIALVKRGPELYITGILPRDGKPPGRDLIAVLFVGQGLPHQAYLAGLGCGPVGEGDTHELAAQALVEKLQAETLDFPAFLLALAETAEDIAEGQHANEDDEIASEQQAALLHILAGLAAQARPVPAIGPDDFTEDDDAIEFYADGEYGVTVERLTLRIEARPFNEEDEDAEDLYDFTLRADGELHDGHSTLAEVARSYPDVSPSIEAWKAGRTVPFAVVVTAARKLSGLAEPLPEEDAGA